MASHFSFLSASLVLLLLATASSVFARHHSSGISAVTKPAAACAASTLAPYAKSVKLTDDGLFVLHWNITKKNDGIMAAIEAKAGSGGETGWISIGWTKKPGLMAPADAVVGNLAGAAPNNVLAYAMTGKVPAQIKKAAPAAVKLSAKSVVTTSDGGKIVNEFTRMGKGGLGPVNYLGSNNMIWAYSDAQAFTSHANRGSLVVNLACKV